MFSDIPDFSEANYRYKVTLRRFIPGSELGVSSDGARFPPGVIDGVKIKLFFNQLVGANRGERRIEKLPLPLSLIATYPFQKYNIFSEKITLALIGFDNLFMILIF